MAGVQKQYKSVYYSLKVVFLMWTMFQVSAHYAQWSEVIRSPLFVFMIFSPITVLLSIVLFSLKNPSSLVSTQGMNVLMALIANLSLLALWFDIPQVAELDKYGQDIMFETQQSTNLMGYLTYRENYHLIALISHLFLIVSILCF